MVDAIDEALHGLDAARRAGWAKAYAAEEKVTDLEDRLYTTADYLRSVLWIYAWESVLESVQENGQWVTRWRTNREERAVIYWRSLPPGLYRDWVMEVLEEHEAEWTWRQTFLDLMRDGLARTYET